MNKLIEEWNTLHPEKGRVIVNEMNTNTTHAHSSLKTHAMVDENCIITRRCIAARAEVGAHVNIKAIQTAFYT